ncbi:hypothetical protein L4D09_13180 [Photobacterium makurazakiensis]|uniref:hypothetical protein n=1 Tax=Photobacterium makurazakiensis TaxID=2910234 RepID=UPI003D12D377
MNKLFYLMLLVSLNVLSAESGSPRVYQERTVPALCGMQLNTATSGISFDGETSNEAPANISLITNDPTATFALKIIDPTWSGFGATTPDFDIHFFNIGGTEYTLTQLLNTDGIDFTVAENVDISLRLAMNKGDLPAGTPKVTVTLQSFCK